MTVDQDVHNDLHDVFASLYDEDDWLPFDDDDVAIHLKAPRGPTPEPHPALDEIVPSEEELRASIDSVLAKEEGQRVAEDGSRFSSKRIREAVDSLLGFRNAEAGPSKRRRAAIPTVDKAPAAAMTVSPYHPQSLLARLQTFRPATYTPKPAALSETEAARCGWVNDGSESLRCAKGCDSWWTVGRVQMNEDALARKLGNMLVNAHKPSCPWRIRQTPASQLAHLRQQLHPPLSSALEPIARRIEAACSASKTSLSVISPLNPGQLETLLSHLNAHAPGSPPLSASAAQAALFGWAPSPMNDQILTCKLCQRRIGLWTTERLLDVVNEHLAWCPVGARGVGHGVEWWASAVVLRAERTGKGLGSLGIAKAQAARDRSVA